MESPEIHNRPRARAPRWSAGTWVLAGLGVIILLIAGEQVRQALHPAPVPQEPPPVIDQGPTQGQAPPDFGLPDAGGVVRHLSDWKGKRFVLNFYCGCDECTVHARRLAQLYKKNKAAPPTLAVFTKTFDKAGKPGFERATSARFNWLFSTDDGKVVDQYHGTPCPRTFIIGNNWQIEFASPRLEPGMANYLAEEVARKLGLNVPLAPVPKPKRPPVRADPSLLPAPNPAGQATPAGDRPRLSGPAPTG